MQARYYDPVIGRFLSVDPVTFMDTGNPEMFGRYSYTYNDPVNMVDPTGEAGEVIWHTPTKATLNARYTIDKSQAEPAFTPELLNLHIKMNFSGTFNINGRDVDVTAVGINTPANDPGVAARTVNVMTVDPENTRANAVPWGTLSTIGPTTTASIASHEIGHNLGALDKYVDVVDEYGNIRSVTDSEHINTIMGDLRSPANDLQMNEIFSAPYTTHSCAPGASGIPEGGC